eukprot:snap_masked-scaffold_47-processed-gene-1.62-mRNA-1 protein AED:1.00 eAED:1.00 QI:0/-1/0/0/-1/1/1/0/700
MCNIGLLIGAMSFTTAKTLEQPVDLWSLDVKEATTLRNRRLDGVTGKSFLELKSSLSELPSILSKTSSINLPLSEEESLSCKISEGNRAVSSVLSKKFPSLHFYSGTCGEVTSGDIQQLELIFNSAEDQVDSFSATITSESRNFYIDSAERGSNKYVLYNTKTARGEMKANGEYSMEDKVVFNKEVISKELKKVAKSRVLEGFDADQLAEELARAAAERKEMLSLRTGYIFNIALLTSQQFSFYHKSTRESVFSVLVILLSRVNGIYARELGLFFKFIEDQDLAICLPGKQETDLIRRRICRSVRNGISIVLQAEQVLNQLGINSSSYDVAHSLVTTKGGIGTYPSLCQSNKTEGATGFLTPDTDVFAVDFVSHELGHQLFAEHSFRDCTGPYDFQLNPDGAVEPGGGSSIMGYAGLCQDKNLQLRSDPYFNSAQLIPMHNYILSVAENGTCGQRFEIKDPEISLSSNIEVESKCTVPVGNPFQLNALGVTGNGFYSWERADTGYEDLYSKTLGRFRSWKPTKSVSRYFPNLHYLIYPETSNKTFEELPSIARNMTMRFTERALFDMTKSETEFSAGIVGQFQTASVFVNFVTSIAPLRVNFSAIGSVVSAGKPIHLSYTADSSVHLVKFYAAHNDLKPVDVFRYETDIVELDWKFIGVGSEGVATLYLPKCLTGEIIIVARVGNEMCFYFDLAVGVMVS